jgi:hypothetical protein
MIYNPKEPPRCSLCGTQFEVANQSFVAEDDDNPDTPTQIFVELLAYCPNPNCANHHGGELGNTAKAVETIRNKVN